MQSHYLQESEWAETRADFDWQSQLITTPAGDIRVYSRKAPLVGMIGYAPMCLPIADDKIKDTLEAIREKTKDHAFVRLEIEQKTSEVTDKILKDSELQKPSKRKIQYKSTVEIDVEQPAHELLESFSKGTRYNIRKAGKRGVEIEEIETTEENLERLYDFKIITSDRSGHYLRPNKFLLKFWGLLAENNAATLVKATHEGEVVAMGLSCNKGDRAWNIATGSLRTKSSLAAPALMHYEVMQKLQKIGIKSYDLTGINPPEIRGDKDNAMVGIDSFKTGFGERYIHDYVGIYDLVNNQKKYDLWNKYETKFVRFHAKLFKNYWW